MAGSKGGYEIGDMRALISEVGVLQRSHIVILRSEILAKIFLYGNGDIWFIQVKRWKKEEIWENGVMILPYGQRIWKKRDGSDMRLEICEL